MEIKIKNSQKNIAVLYVYVCIIVVPILSPLFKLLFDHKLQVAPINACNVLYTL